jgi:hypothetical protein
MLTYLLKPLVELPENLTQQVKAVRDDDVLLSSILHSHPSETMRSNTTGKPFQYCVTSTKEILDVKAYAIIEHIFPEWDVRPRGSGRTRYPPSQNCVLVAQGANLVEPVLLGRFGTHEGKFFKVWRGAQGFDESFIVVKRSSKGARLPLESDNTLLRERARDAADRGRLNACFIDGGNAEDSDARPGNSAAPRSAPEAWSEPVCRDQDVAMLEQTSTSHEPIYISDDSPPRIKAEPLILNCRIESLPDLVKLSMVSFVFNKGGNSDDRVRSYTQCNTVGKLFAQAKAAGILKDNQDDGVLAARIDWGPEVKVVQGDEDDFNALDQAVKAVVFDERWADGARTFVVRVRGV